MKKIFFPIFILFATLLPTFAQQEAMYTHYMYNTLGVNPAYAGSRDALTITALHRSQWVGFEGAPNTQTLTLHSPVVTDAVNLGLSFIHDKIGPVRTTALFIDYAFRFKIGSRGKMSLGVKMGFNNYNFNLNELSINDINDPAFLKNDGAFSPNFGVGIYYAQPEFYAGISTPKLFKNNYAYSIPKDGLSLEQRHFYLIGGGIIPLTVNLKLMPTSLVKITPGAPIEADFTANFLIYDRFLIGAMYRTGDAIGLMAGFYITEQLCAGYSYDWSFVNQTGRYNYGSHEVVLRYDLVFGEKKRIRSPRYFCKY